jgi:PPP family 3-phenylpropionic acid transporter
MWSLGVLAEIAFFYFQAPLFRYFGVRSMMLASLLLAVVRFAMIGTGAGSLLVLLAAQLLHGATFGIHNSASVATLQRWFAGPLQARGQALFASLSYGLGGTLGSLAMSVVWDGIGASAVFLLASGLALGGLLAAWLSYRWQDAYVAR